ncbi:MAG: EamA family transporter, partial [Anaerolineae bacterium]
MSSTVSPAGRNWTLIAAFAIVYVIWGSTYLAIGYAIDTIPPLLMASVRFLIAGGALYAMARWRGAAPPLRIHWRSTLIIGALLFLGGNGGVTWSEQFVPTGLASLVVAIVPVWVVLLEWLLPNGRRPTMPVIIGVLVGLAGMALLVSSNGSSGSTQQFTVPGLLVLMASTFCWA